MQNFSWREFIVDRLLSLPPEALRRIGMETGLISTQDVDTVAPGELATLLLKRAAGEQKEQILVAAVYRELDLEVPPDSR